MPSAQLSQPITELTFRAFLHRMQVNWHPGRHIAIIGPTECGKSYVAYDLLQLRKYAVLFTLKVEDKTTKRYEGFKRITEWAKRHSKDMKILYWPRVKNLRAMKEVQDEAYSMLNDIFLSGGWTICFDDLRVVCDQLGLKREVASMYVFVRSHGTSLIGLYQRPAFVCKEALSQCWYWMVFYVSSDDDLVDIAKAAGVDPNQARAMNKELRQFDFMLFSRTEPPAIVRRERAA